MPDEPIEKASNRVEESKRRAIEIHEKHADRILDTYRNVTVVNIGYKRKDGVELRDGNVCLLVWVRKKLPENQVEPDQLLPKEIDGVDVDVLEGDLALVFV